jgi:PAB-dependent poly(A)-specific ribonuclease subunit 2
MRLALARVSCLRGEGPMQGVPFIDSCVIQAEPVVDYLTRYSGLRPGDLDPSVSRHHITSMKAAYLKLRQLIDNGCCFVGHGLKKDFEMINVVLPKGQIIDTVELFHQDNQRLISLRFLAWHLLNQQMSSRQQDTHDSIEDAHTALQLYNKYLELKAEGEAAVEATIQMLYDIGRETHWEVPAN